jgi:hypothetical protein
MTARQKLIQRTVVRLNAQGGYPIPSQSRIHEALLHEGWSPEGGSDASFRRLITDVRTAFILRDRDVIVAAARTRAGLA